jgi:multiple sugar transport system ATP-binding protein
VAGIIGSPQINFIEGKVTLQDERYYFENKRMKLLIPQQFYADLGSALEPSCSFVMGVRPKHVLLSGHSEKRSGYNLSEGRKTFNWL